MQYINNKKDDLEKINFNLKIHSKDRNLDLQKNPFDFRISFDPVGSYDSTYGTAKYPNYFISSKFENLKSIKITDMIVPTKIYTDHYGIRFPNVNVVKMDPKIARLIIDNNNVEFEIDNTSGGTITLTYQDTVIKLNKVLGSNIIMINKKPYYIDNINSTSQNITFKNQLPNDMEIEDFYFANSNDANMFKVDLDNGIIENNYLKNILNKNDILYDNDRAFIIDQIKDNKIRFTMLYGTSTSKKSYWLMERNHINVSEEKCFFLKIKEFKQTKETSNDINLNDSIGTFYTDKVSAESVVLVGNGVLNFYDRDLKNLNSLSFTLMNQRGETLGEIYKDFNNHKLKDDFNNVILNVEITVLKEKFN